MIAKWASGFPVACDNLCIISGIYQFYFYVFVERSTSLNDLVRIANIVLPVTAAVLDGVMVLIVALALT